MVINKKYGIDIFPNLNNICYLKVMYIKYNNVEILKIFIPLHRYEIQFNVF